MHMPIDQPGFYEMPAEAYHADPCKVPSLSRSLAHVMVSESPAHAFAAHPNLGRRVGTSTEEMDFGDVGHALLLGKGKSFAVWPEDSWRGKEAGLFWDKAMAEHCTPVLKKNLNRAEEMAGIARDRMVKLGLGNPFDDATSELKNETVAVWTERGIWCRAMLDAPRLEQGIIFDLKTTNSAHPRAIAARAGPMGHHMQDSWYRRAVTTLRPELEGRLKFIFIHVETKYPFAVTPVEMNGEFKTIGTSACEAAIELWRRCTETNHWPAYAEKLITIEPKPWLLVEEFGRETAEETMRKK